MSTHYVPSTGSVLGFDVSEQSLIPVLLGGIRLAMTTA